MIRCGLLCSTFWADLKTLRILRESQTSDMPTKEATPNVNLQKRKRQRDSKRDIEKKRIAVAGEATKETAGKGTKEVAVEGTIETAN
ncbi:hypothetical protein AVEN_123183-1 [Araneus ventricosus]|uniref:Uncharacterized protein n=1 Tax=Araneus ventricosus TaxID=182803 RepID=A0A4Y2JFE4_ARAVE|nr:hypothetical protein AVEN_193843-1 [Araneus ventricosus]GBM88737.1 hypothetical protein AVEN_123183-1 [Araneus ventricosus]